MVLSEVAVDRDVRHELRQVPPTNTDSVVPWAHPLKEFATRETGYDSLVAPVVSQDFGKSIRLGRDKLHAFFYTLKSLGRFVSDREARMAFPGSFGDRLFGMHSGKSDFSGSSSRSPIGDESLG
jgi:hypothetical protein